VFGGHLYHRYGSSYGYWGYGYPWYGYGYYGYGYPYGYLGGSLGWYGYGSRSYRDDTCDPDSDSYDPEACSEASARRSSDTTVAVNPSFLDEGGEAPEALPDEAPPPGSR